MNDDKRTQWLRGVLDLCVLAILSDGEQYGYELIQKLEHSGVGSIKGGTLYPLMARLEKAGHVTAKWREGTQGPSRKYYYLTPEGSEFLNIQARHWEILTSSIDTLLVNRGKNEKK